MSLPYKLKNLNLVCHLSTYRRAGMVLAASLFVISTSCNRHAFQPQSAAQDDVSLALEGLDIDTLDWTGVVNREGEEATSENEPDVPLVLSFIYTRCPMKTMCPMAVANLKAVTDQMEQQQLDGKVILFSIDPSFDSPDVLTEYGDTQGLAMKRWSLLTGDREAFGRITKRFGITTEGESGAIMHNMRTMVMDSDHVTRWVYRGGALPSQEIVAAMKALQPQ